jgi:hypothetical protein
MEKWNSGLKMKTGQSRNHEHSARARRGQAAASTESASGEWKFARLGTQKPVPIARRVASVEQSVRAIFKRSDCVQREDVGKVEMGWLGTQKPVTVSRVRNRQLQLKAEQCS